MKIKDSIALVTGSNRGIGKALVSALIERGAKKVYAGVRDVEAFRRDESQWLARNGNAIVPLRLDITRPEQVEDAANTAGDVGLLINNGGIAKFQGLIAAESMDAAREEMEVNYFGTLAMSRAFAPVLKRNGGGAILNVLSVASLANFPALGSYSASKAALHSLTQGIRAELAAQGTEVFGLYPGPIDTDMAKDVEMEKSSPAELANGTLDAIERGREDIFIDPMSVQFEKDYRTDAKSQEKQIGQMLPV